MMKEKIYLGLFFLLVTLGGCEPRTPKISTSKIIKINLGDDPHTLDPRLARDTSSLALLRMFFEGLTRIAPSNCPELALAENVVISEDLKTYTFILRKATWSNGDPIKASDFVYSWTSTLLPSFRSDTAFQLYVIKNGKALKEGKVPEVELGVKAVGDQMLVVTLEYPVPYFLELLAFPVFFPIHPQIDREFPHWAEKKDHYVTNGPFLPTHWRSHDCLNVKKSPSYWDASNVYIDGIDMIMVSEDVELKLFEKKELHWAGSPLSVLPLDSLNTFKQQGNLNVKLIAGTQFIRTNVEMFPFQNPKIRKAFAYAIDRAAIVEHVTQGGQLPAKGYVPSSLLPKMTSYFSPSDEQLARLLLKEGLEGMETSLKNLPQITLSYVASERANLIAQAIQQQWYQKLGIHVVLEGIERKIYYDRLARHDYQLSLGSWLADVTDPVNFLEIFKYKTQSTNNTNWENSHYIDLLNASFQTKNFNERQEKLIMCEEILMEEMPILPVYHYSMLYLKDEKLNGVFISSLGNLDFKWATLENKK